ncbi:MAG: 30S ribosomal protein S8, partial [Deltaproteobacteria bacterium]|nr:30S ribosomal protein S8 [Deltaproteobacteria bacterium]
DRKPVISGVKKLSTPGLRVYYRSHEIPTIRNGLGVVILTTSTGLMTDRSARKSKLGGEALCLVW